MTVKSKVVPSSRVGVAHPSDIDCSSDVPLVKQEFKDDCDVNLIIARCLRNGAPLPFYENIQPVFADVSDLGDYRDVIHRVRAVEDEFAKMDAKVRGRFQNDPVAMVEFLKDPANYDEAVELGLLIAPKATELPEGQDVPSKPKAKPAKPAKPIVDDEVSET